VRRAGFGFHSKGKVGAVTIHYRVDHGFLGEKDLQRKYSPSHHGRAVEAIKGDSERLIQSIEKALTAFAS
jgi:hypothetical protein